MVKVKHFRSDKKEHVLSAIDALNQFDDKNIIQARQLFL